MRIMCAGKDPCIETGNAGITVSSDNIPYGRLHVSHVIHVVGPDYRLVKDGNYRETDKQLRKAYIECLYLARSKDITHIGFPILSSGIFRGGRELEDIIIIGVNAIKDFSNHIIYGVVNPLREVVLFGYTEEEKEILEKINL